jgi:hypothetical protein
MGIRFSRMPILSLPPPIGGAMKYLLLAYINEQLWQVAPVSEQEAFSQACRANDAALIENGYLLAAAQLQTGNSAAIVRVQDGNLNLTDNLAEETEAALTAIYHINARDLNDAIRIASQMPQARRGFIEVKRILE